jgi:hypothetical protein
VAVVADTPDGDGAADRGAGDASSARALDPTTTGDPGRGAASGSGNRAGLPQPARSATGADQSHGSNQHADEASVSPPVVAHDDTNNAPDLSADVPGHLGGGGDTHPQAVDGTDLAAQINGRTGAGQAGGVDAHASAGTEAQDDRSGHGQDVAQPIVTRQAVEPVAVAGSDAHGGVGGTGGRSIGGDDGSATARNVPAPVVAGPDRANGASTHTNAITDHPSHDNSSDVHVSNPQVAGATKPQTTQPSTASPATPSSTPATAQHGDGGGDSTKADSTQKSSTSTAPAPHTSGSDNHSGDSSSGR